MVFETANLHKLNIFKPKRLIAAFVACTLHKRARTCSSSGTKEQKERNLGPDKAMERLGIVNP
jgi:hypothetical protein